MNAMAPGEPMKSLPPICLVAITALTAAGCAGTPDPAPAGTAVATGQTSCRKLITPGEEADPVLCGTAEQWAEFDRRAALINAGVTCRKLPTEVCLTAEQWKTLDRRSWNLAEAQRMGVEGRRDAERMGQTWEPPLPIQPVQ